MRFCLPSSLAPFRYFSVLLLLLFLCLTARVEAVVDHFEHFGVFRVVPNIFFYSSLRRIATVSILLDPVVPRLL